MRDHLPTYRAILQLIEAHRRILGVAPSLTYLAANLDMTPAGVRYHLLDMSEQGYIRVRMGQYRRSYATTRLTAKGKRLIAENGK